MAKVPAKTKAVAKKAAARTKPEPSTAPSDERTSRRYVELRFSDSHVTTHRCRVCREPVSGVFVAAVHRGGRGQWLWDAHHLACAARVEPQLARELFECPRPRELASSAASLREHVAQVTLDAKAACFTRRALRDVGRLFGLARRGVCALCDRAIEGVALTGPRVNLGRTEDVPFHLSCVLDTSEVSREEILDRLRTIDPSQRDLADDLRRAFGIATPETTQVTLLGADRRSAKREQLLWELWFDRAPSRPRVEALVPGAFSWEQATIAEVRPAASATTLGFRDAVVGNVEALASEGLYAASFCEAGDRPLARARAREAAGGAPYPFAFVGRGQHPRGGEWRVRVRLRCEQPAPAASRTFDRWFEGLRVDGPWISFRARYRAIPSDAPYQAALRAALDEVLLAIHGRTPIALAVLGDTDNAAEGDAWHRDSLARVDPAILAEARAASNTPVRLPNEEVERLRREARDAHAHADEMGDPKAAWEALDEILRRIPPDETALRQEVSALLGEVIAASTASPSR